MRRILALGLLAAVLAAPLQAQQASHRFPRKWLFAGIGALISGSVAAIYAANFQDDIGGCSSVPCVAGVSVAGGMLVGFMIGNEVDHLYGIRYRHAPPIALRGKALSLAVVPTDLTVRERTAFVTGEQGIELVGTDSAFEPIGFRARGLRAIGPVASDSALNLLLVGTAAGLYRFRLRGDEPGALAYQGDISALARHGGFLALGLGTELQLAAPDDSIAALGDALPTESRVMDLAWQGDTTLWALTEDRLLAFAVDASGDVTPRGEFQLPAIGRRLTLRDSLAFVAAGSGGLYAVDIRNPDAPVETANWSGARFVYDVTASGHLVYVAAGPEGLYVLRFDGASFTPVGLSRGLGFVASVEAGPDAVFALDRAGGTLRRINPLDAR
jgi:hypothetical protein